MVLQRRAPRVAAPGGNNRTMIGIIRRGCLIAGIATILIIAISTVSPIYVRPMSGLPPDIERFAAFAIVGGFFVLGAPQRWPSIVLLVVIVAALLEIGQEAVPGRHGTVHDFMVKAVGGAAGAGAALFLNAIVRRSLARVRS